MSTSEFVFTHKMGIGGIVLQDKEERIIFRIPLGEGGLRRRRTTTETTYRRRCDGTYFYAPIANSSFSSKLGEIFVKEQFASKLRVF